MYENGEWFDEDVISQAVLNRLNAWLQFKHDTGFIVEQSEVPMMSTKYLFAGTPDKIGQFQNGNVKRAAVELHNNGSYKVIPYTDRNDVNLWMATLAVYQWKQNNLKGR
jgi:hypothetical protein